MTSSGSTNADTLPVIASIARILQRALEQHEEIEVSGGSPVAELCRHIGLNSKAVPIEHVATILFSFVVFGDSPPVGKHQAALQDALIDALDRGERMLYRQIRMQPLRAWRYRAQAGGRAVASQLAGPATEREEFFDALIDIARADVVSGGGPCIGWPVSLRGGRHVMVAAGMLSPEAESAISELVPFPMPEDEHTFWRERRADVLRLAVDPMGMFLNRRGKRSARDAVEPDAFREGAKVVLTAPSRPQELLERVVLGADFEFTRGRVDWYRRSMRRVRWMRESIARARTADDMAPIVETLQELRYVLLGSAGQGRYEGPDDPELEEWLPTSRILDAFGVRTDGTMSGADPTALRNQPASVLLVEAGHPMHADVHGREPIRAALDWARTHREGAPSDSDADADATAVEAAFTRYVDERRWMATFAALDLDRDAHLDRIDYATVTHALGKLFEPSVLETPLESLDIDGRQLGWLENALRAKPYTDENEVIVGDLPEDAPGLLRLRNVGETSLFQVKRALLALADGWRAWRAGLDPRELEVRVAESADVGTEDLSSGLDELADLFS